MCATKRLFTRSWEHCQRSEDLSHSESNLEFRKVTVTDDIEFNFRFPGQYYDGESGLSNNLLRDYYSHLGRYIQRDRLGIFDGTNTYSYSHQNPVSNADPTGEFVPQMIGFAIGAGLEYLTNPNATLTDIALAGAIGALGGQISKSLFLRYGPKSLTRVHGKEWSHAISKKVVNKQTSGWLRKLLNKRGGLNGSWASPKRHYRHDMSRWPKGWRDFGRRLPKGIRDLDRVPDWLKGTMASGILGERIAGNQCE